MTLEHAAGVGESAEKMDVASSFRLSAVHALCVRQQAQPQWSYIPCTPFEYLILLRLLDVQGEASVPFQVLFPQRLWPPGETPSLFNAISVD